MPVHSKHSGPCRMHPLIRCRSVRSCVSLLRCVPSRSLALCGDCVRRCLRLRVAHVLQQLQLTRMVSMLTAWSRMLNAKSLTRKRGQQFTKRQEVQSRSQVLPQLESSSRAVQGRRASDDHLFNFGPVGARLSRNDVRLTPPPRSETH